MTFEIFRHFPKEHLPDIAHDICGRDDDRDTANYSHQPLHTPNTQKDWEFCNEAGEERHTHRYKSANDKANGGKGHDLCHATEFGNLTCMRPVIDHADNRKEE